MPGGNGGDVRGTLRSIITAACCSLAWAFGIAVALLLVTFPTIAMSAFFLVGLPAAALLGLLTQRLTRFLEPTDVIAGSTRVQATALLSLLAFAAPILGSRYVPGIRLFPLQDPPGHPTIVFSASGLDGNPEIYLMRRSAADLTRLTVDPASELWPALSPDGSEVVFVSTRDGDADVYVLRVDDPGSIRQLTDEPGNDFAPTWSPDGTRIAFTSVRGGNADIWTMDAHGGDLSNLTARSLADDSEPTWSPDGTAIAFARSRGGVGTIGIVPAHGGHPSLLTPSSVRWATRPQWSQDGSGICFDGVAQGAMSSDIFTIRPDGTGLMRVTSDPSAESYCHWFDHDRFLWLVSDLPDLGYDFAYYVPSSGGEITLFLRG
jgi:dipeptidyl aminopeptidase/acylaminoacyl peptidase